MSNSIKISPKHGVNPTIPHCFFCGKEKNMVALLGRIDSADSEAPRNCVIDYEPCEECESKMKQGITLIEVSDAPLPDERPEIAPDLYPTGAWAVVSEHFIRNFINDPEMISKVLHYRKTFVQQGLIQSIQRCHVDENGQEC